MNKEYILIGGRMQGRTRDLINQLISENKQLKEELKYTVPIVEHNKIVSKKLKEIRQLKEKKEELKKWLEEINSPLKMTTDTEVFCKIVLDKIKELEEGINGNKGTN